MMAECAFGENEAQGQYWNSAAGEKWVRHHEVIDQQLEVVTDVLLEAAAPQPGEAVLDVGCGTGATLLRIAAAVGETGSALGCDISSSMLGLARQRIAAAGVRNVVLVQGRRAVTRLRGGHI
jgi:cyclopropane fatty-acyl-phospholipid synthase-like methyltransferase